MFGEKGCIRCHSVSGEDDSLGPDLRTVSRSRGFADLAAALWNHLPTMAERMDELGIERPRLNPQEAGDLIAFLYTLDYFESPGDTARGRASFQDLKCIRCHRVGGVGGVVGPDLDHIGSRRAPIELASAMWNHAPAMIAAARARGIELPTLDGSQLADLIAYMEGESDRTAAEGMHVLPGRADRGRTVMEESGCPACHGMPGGGGGRAPDLAGRARGHSLTDFAAAMWNKGPAMRAAAESAGIELPSLTPGDFADIVAYLYSVDYFARTGSAGRGRQLLSSAGCMECHSSARREAEAAPDLSRLRGLDHGSSVVAGLWNHTRLSLRSPADVPRSWPLIPPSQMADLIAYFEVGSP